MTRISVGIRAKELCDKHLVRERIELLRIPNGIKSGKSKVDFDKIPIKFKLGTGHTIFFYNKLLYLHKRYIELTEECDRRGFTITDFSSSFEGLPSELYNDYIETPEDREILIERINERLQRMSNLKYYREPIDLEDILLK